MPSTVIKSFSYDPRKHLLKITFISGKKYGYLNVAEENYEALKSASSKGEYFNKHIKNQHEFRKLDL